MRKDEVLKYAQAGYEAYATNTGGKTWDGREMPTWNELPRRTIEAWCAAAAAIIEAHAGAVIS